MTTFSDEQLADALKGATDDQLVEWYVNFRSFFEREATAQETYLAAHVAKQSLVGGELHRRLLERNPNWQPGVKASGSTEHGTFFLKTDTSIKVADRLAFHEFVLENHAMNLLTAHVAKEAVEEYEKEKGQLPPGVTKEQFAKLQVRKT